MIARTARIIDATVARTIHEIYKAYSMAAQLTKALSLPIMRFAQFTVIIFAFATR